MGIHGELRQLVAPDVTDMVRAFLQRLMAAMFLSGMATPALAECKLALVLGLDISASVDNKEYRIQFEGLADALDDPAVMRVILEPEGTYIEAAVFEWSGHTQQLLVRGWTRLDSPSAIREFAQSIRTHRRPMGYLATAIGKAVQFAGGILATAPTCQRRVLDLSGDGINNIGPEPPEIYATGLFDGVTVNGLVIRGAEPDPLTYYYSHVILGEEAFVIVAEDYADYARAMRRKLLREIQPEMIVGAQ